MNILVVDDHPLVIEALRHVLVKLAAEVNITAARSAVEARTYYDTLPGIDLLLIDLGLPGVDGFTLLEEVRTRHPALPVVVLSGSRRREDVMRALDRGAMGYITKTSSSDVMLGALRLVMAGSVYLPPEALASSEPPEPGARGSVADIAPQALGLTARQIDVLKLMLEGKPNKGISRELGLSPSTVKIHVAAILKAFDVDTRAQVIVEAGRRGFKYG